ncbi:hypothetical protein NE237_011151 [Protea cynaroides]|uniref:TF-B3 domain-containing protein n=1 Tax=Protea cynaroides TaxID=273540 RepID=A0A9Q0GXC9_9MAGN|nr:hypothetical protein NE237_011151 [Protea cynaroides]
MVRRSTLFFDFLNPEAPPVTVNIRDDNNAPPWFRDLMGQWPVKKVLTARDINYSQVVMPRDQVEDFILPKLLPDEQNTINRGEQFPITVRDLDTMTEYPLCLWENGSSYVLTSGWSSFVRRGALQVGEEVVSVGIRSFVFCASLCEVAHLFVIKSRVICYIEV